MNIDMHILRDEVEKAWMQGDMGKWWKDEGPVCLWGAGRRAYIKTNNLKQVFDTDEPLRIIATDTEMNVVDQDLHNRLMPIIRDEYPKTVEFKKHPTIANFNDARMIHKEDVLRVIDIYIKKHSGVSGWFRRAVGK